MTREAAKQRISKLLALAARPGTPAEGQAAMDAAQRLADKHGLVIRRKQKPKIDLGGALRDMFSGFNYREWEERVDRATAEQHAQWQAAQRAKADREKRRQATRQRNLFDAGHQAYTEGQDRRANPYKRGMMFGVDQRAWWYYGWDQARIEAQEAK